MKNKKSIKVIFDRRKKTSSTTPGYVELSVYCNGIRKYISTGVCVYAHEWSDEYMVVGRRDSAQLNKSINDLIERFSVYNNPADIVQSRNSVRIKNSSTSFLDFIEKGISECNLSSGTLNHHKALLYNLNDFGKIKRFEDVTSDNVQDFLSYVSKRNIMQTTVSTYYKRLKKWIFMAQRRDLIPHNAINGVECKNGKSRIRESLSDDEIRMWIDAPVKHRYLIDARDRFIVEMGTGLSFSDLIDADFSKIELIDGIYTINGIRKKTGEQFFSVILPWAYDVLKNHNFSFSNITNQKYNEYLGSIALICGINKHVTSHVGRHTYACYCLRHGVRIEAVQRTLGHSSIKTTQIYAKMVDMDVVKSFSELKL